jgi:hypothetical protein
MFNMASSFITPVVESKISYAISISPLRALSPPSQPPNNVQLVRVFIITSLNFLPLGKGKGKGKSSP